MGLSGDATGVASGVGSRRHGARLPARVSQALACECGGGVTRSPQPVLEAALSTCGGLPEDSCRKSCPSHMSPSFLGPVLGLLG